MNDHTLRVYDSIIGLLPNADNPTPLVRLNKIVPFEHTQVFAKLEWYNPFGAVKDRIADHMIRDAEQRGALGNGQKLVEATSGNTGVGLAMVGNAKGYSLQTPLSAAIPLEKRTVLRFFGSDVVELDDTLCPAPGAPEGAISLAMETAETQPDYVMLNQYANEANPDSHYRTTGPEIWRQTQGKVTDFVAGLGTCGTITGTGKFLKEQRAEVKVIGVHPEDGHDIPGVRSLTQLQQTKFYLPDQYDQTIEVTNRESFDMCLRLNREESVIAGPSSGMALVGALRTVRDEPGTIVVVIFPDSVFKYASSFQRHFPYVCPADKKTGEQDTGSSKNDQLLARMMENLKNPYDTIKADDLANVLNAKRDIPQGQQVAPRGRLDTPQGQLHAPQRPLVVDVRLPELFTQSHVPGSVNIPMDDLPDRTDELPPDRDAPIVMVCGIGKFSKNTVLYMKSLGYRNTRSLRGGINEWVRKGHPTESNTTCRS